MDLEPKRSRRTVPQFVLDRVEQDMAEFRTHTKRHNRHPRPHECWLCETEQKVRTKRLVTAANGCAYRGNSDTCVFCGFHWDDLGNSLCPNHPPTRYEDRCEDL